MNPLWTLFIACTSPPAVSDDAAQRGAPPAAEPESPTLRRLTDAQYRRSISDLFGGEIVVPALEPDDEVDRLFAVGAAVSSLSPLGVERYEDAAFSIAAQVVALGLPCAAEGTVDAPCAESFLLPLGDRVYRRPLSDTEIDALVDIAGISAEVLESFSEGVVYALAAMLQSPNFLYRIELGESAPEGGLRYTDYEMASRLSYFLTDSTPDAELLEAAAAGELTTEAGLAAQVDRILESPGARNGVRTLFSEMLGLHRLDALSKDPTIFVYWSDTLPLSAREETLRGIEHLVFDQDEDYRTLFTTRETWLDRNLAALYSVQAPVADGFGQTTLPGRSRRGLLGHASILALEAHPVSTSVTRRGAFVREALLCQNIPSPPSDVDTSIPQASGEAPTMRDRVARHLEDPLCASCHQLTDPIGLGLENFDGLGGWRDDEAGFDIDPSGELDGESFTDAWELAGVISEHPDLPLCLVDTVYRYAHGQDAGSSATLDWHAAGFRESEFSVLELLRDIALSPGFRTLESP